jgi:hypothetical protein
MMKELNKKQKDLQFQLNQEPATVGLEPTTTPSTHTQKNRLGVAALFIFISLIALGACTPQKKPLDPRFDDALYEQQNATFYKGKKDGKLYIKTPTLVPVKDSANQLVFAYRQVPDLDLGSFVQLEFGGYYAKDKNRVYTWDIDSAGQRIDILPGADPGSFEPFGSRWAKDKQQVYHQNQVVKGLVPNQIVIICQNPEDSGEVYIDYIRDNDQLFFSGVEVIVPDGMDVSKLGCKEDMFGKPFIEYQEHLYVMRKGRLELYQ